MRRSTIYYIKIFVVICLSVIVVSCSANQELEDLFTPIEPTPIVIDDVINEELSEPKLNTSDDERDSQLEFEAEPEGAVDQENSNEENTGELVVKQGDLPKGFVYLDEVIPTAQFEMRYYSDYNFVGTQIDGYLAPLAIGTSAMAEALLKVSDELEGKGYKLLIYDTYRPAKAVQQFLAWSKDTDDIVMKEDFYPNIDKATLFKSGYLSSKSGHSRGSTVDLTLIDADTGKEVDMGSPYDLLDEISHFSTKLITDEQAANRQLLQDVMMKYGFKPYSKEWWHYVLKNEPYPSTYYDFDVQ